jgi:hypothetical protein
MGEYELAIVATQNMLFPEIAFVGGERAIVIGGQCFGIGTKISGRSGEGVGIWAGSCGGTQMASERFFKGPVAVVRRHGFLLP